MIGGSTATPEIDRRGGLPPDEYWAIDPSQTIATPVDSRGLIIVDELIPAVKAFICTEYAWPPDSNEHHIYHEEEVYRELELWTNGHIPSRQFRELPANKILVPTQFHNVLHKVARPAAMPAPETMRRYIEAWRVARDLFVSVRNVAKAERLARRREARGGELTAEEQAVGREIMEEAFIRHFRGVTRHLDALSAIPQEYWPFSPDQTPLLAAGQIGDLVLRRHQPRRRAVLLPEEPHKPCECLRCKVNSSIITSVNN